MKTAILAAAFAAMALPGWAQTDPIETRQLLMMANGHGAAIAGQVMRGDIEYHPVIGRASISAMHAASQAFGDYFPEGSLDTERSDAAPEIWENMDDFMALLENFRTAAAAAKQASGDDGPPDAESFVAAVQPMLDTCRDCHESYRLDQ